MNGNYYPDYEKQISKGVIGSNPIQLAILYQTGINKFEIWGILELTDDVNLNGASMGKLLYPLKIGNERLSGEALAMAA